MIAVEPLTPDAFAPFGRVVDLPDREPDSVGDPWSWWAEAGVLARADGRYAIGYLHVRNGRTGFDWAERHARSEELVVPVSGELLVYVAPPGDTAAPAPDAFRVFRVRPGQAVVLGKGVWHGAPLAGGEEAAALVLLLEGTGENDTEMAEFDEIPVEV